MFGPAWHEARTIAATQHWLLTAEQAKAVGLTRSQIDSAVRRGTALALVAGVYLLDGDLFTDIPEHLWWRAALHAHGPSACLVDWTGARAIGAQGLPMRDPTIDVALIGGGSRHHRAFDPLRMSDGREIIVRQLPITAAEIAVVDGMRVREPRQTIVDAALMLDTVHALCLFDWALHVELMDQSQLTNLVANAKRRPGVVHVRKAAMHADGRAQSPLESRCRLACIDGDVAPDELQYPVANNWGVVVAYGDLAWLKRKRTPKPLIAEADGTEPHSRPKPLLYDRRRQNDVVLQECDVVRFTWADALRPAYVQGVVRAALAAA